VRRLLLILALLLALCPVATGQQTGAAARFRSGTALPSTCRVGDVFYKTTATSGQYNCTATNTFTLVGGTSSPVTGSGTNGTVPKFTGSASIGNSPITTTASTIAVNSTAATNKYVNVEVTGLDLAGTGGVYGAYFSVGGGNSPDGEHVQGLSATAIATSNSLNTGGPGGVVATAVVNPGITVTTVEGQETNARIQDGGVAQTVYGSFNQVTTFGAASIASDAWGGYYDIAVFGTSTVNNPTAIQGLIRKFGGASYTGAATGLKLDGWTGTAPTSYGIYLGSSIDIGTTRWAIYSLSTSKSLFSGNVNFSGATTTATATTAAQIVANQNDYNPGGQSYFQRWSSDASRNVTGLTFTVVQADGESHDLCNTGAQNIVLVHDDGSSSTAANRFKFKAATNRTVAPDECVLVTYDSSTARWRAN
jgi:hypothetical protein